MSCTHCGKPLPAENSQFCTHCGEPVAPASPGFSPEVAKAATRRAAEDTAQVVQSVLEDPRLRERLPGRSLALLGAGLVVLAILLSALPFFSGIGVVWSVVMLAGGVLIGVRELHAAGRSLPEPAVRAARLAEHPLFLPVFTVLTFVQAFLALSVGLVPLLWLLAAVVLGYDQRRALAAFGAEEGTPSPEERRLGRWVLAGTLVCAAALFLTWGQGGGYFLGGFQPVRVREWTMDGFGREYEDHYEYRYNMWTNYVSAYASSGRGRPFASGVVLMLGGLVLLTRGRRARASLPSWILPVLAGAVTLWGVAGLASFLGPWLFLVGALVIDVAVVRARSHLT
ncbi:zinc ribbon domain-containing protein [Archangium violaceum]|uniref:zinc ribbon domain-containing protein n=1 Tax=Archangium violaceum TaxID=83451 RepID=UPI002B2CA407|nr:zinc ribbon domain-containing protein [Archangium violaceum]